MSDGGGKAEMVAECFNRGKHPKAKRRWPRNIDLENSILAFGEANRETVLPAEAEDLLDDVHMGR